MYYLCTFTHDPDIYIVFKNNFVILRIKIIIKVIIQDY